MAKLKVCKFKFQTTVILLQGIQFSPPTVQKLPNFGSDATRRPLSRVVTWVCAGVLDTVAYTGRGNHSTDLLRGTLVMSDALLAVFTSPEHRRTI